MNKLWLPVLAMALLCTAATQSSNITSYLNKAEQYTRDGEAQWAESVATGDTAVAQGSESWVRQTGERGRFVWTDTWILREGRWQIVAAEDLIANPLQAA